MYRLLARLGGLGFLLFVCSVSLFFKTKDQHVAQVGLVLMTLRPDLQDTGVYR